MASDMKTILELDRVVVLGVFRRVEWENVVIS